MLIIWGSFNNTKYHIVLLSKAEKYIFKNFAKIIKEFFFINVKCSKNLFSYTYQCLLSNICSLAMWNQQVMDKISNRNMNNI